MHHLTDGSWLATAVERCDSFERLAELAISELRKFESGAGIVCGPVTTGGLGSVEANLKVFIRTIETLRREGASVFDQMPYEPQIFLLTQRWKDANPNKAADYHEPVMGTFYAPLFSTGLITRAWFIPGWESSKGACWERAYFAQHSIACVTLHGTPQR